MKRTIISFILVLALTLVLVPFVSFAQNQGSTGIVPTSCDGPDCTFTHLLELATRFMNFLIVLSLPMSAIAFSYAGYLFLTAAGSEGQIGKAKEIFTKVLIGFIFVLGAWLIVNAITAALLNPDNFYNLLG